MGIGRWNSWGDMDQLRQQVGRLFDEARSAQPRGTACGYVWSPLADVLETPPAIIIQIELPGIRPEQVVVEIVDGDLVVRGERPCEREEPDPGYIILERAHGTFARRFALPAGVNGEGVEAVLVDGLLTVTVPKRVACAPARFTLAVD